MKYFLMAAWMLLSFTAKSQITPNELKKLLEMDDESFSRYAKINGYKLVKNSFKNPDRTHDEDAEIEYSKLIGSKKLSLSYISTLAGSYVFYETTDKSEALVIRTQFSNLGYKLLKSYSYNGNKIEDYEKTDEPFFSFTIFPPDKKNKTIRYGIGFGYFN